MKVVCEIWFQGGIRNGRKLEGKRAEGVYEMTHGGEIGATFLACHYLRQEVGGKKPRKGAYISAMTFPYSQRYEIVERRQIGRLVKLRARLATDVVHAER
jgi:hypothetical protein